MSPSGDPVERARRVPFYECMREIVIPRTASLQNSFRQHRMYVLHARIACLLENCKDCSLSQKKPGWNYLLLPKDREDTQIVAELAPGEGEIVVTKTTDSALTGTSELHRKELEILNIIYCHVISSRELMDHGYIACFMK